MTVRAGAARRPALRLAAMLLVALAAGAANVFAFAPFGLWPLQLLLLALLFHFLHGTASVQQGAALGLAYGWGWAAAGVHWLYVSMHHYGGMPSWMAALAVALLAVWLGLFAALAAGATTWLRRRWNLSATLTLLLVAPALWALGEWLRGWIFTGFPWLVSGYAHNESPLAGFAPLVGVYGIGWLAALAAGALALLPRHRMPVLLLLPVLLAAGWGLQTVSWTGKHGEAIAVRLLQGNVPQDMKFERERIATTLAEYEFMIRQQPADLIATPETALPLLSHQLPEDYLARLGAFARQSGSHIVVGLPMSDGPGRYANSVLGLAPAGTPDAQGTAYRYDKHHLVPFGEFIPPGFRWFVDMMHIPLGDFTRGAPLQAPFQVKDQWILPNICYEDLFGEEIADQLAAGHFGEIPQTSVLLNVSNIAWFGDTIALPQHLQISQMRALETGRPMLRATNTGATAVIDHKGRVTAQLPPFQQGVLAATVQGYIGATPYILLGNGPAVLLALLALAIARFLHWKKAGKQPETGKNR
ncbi:apolipoprotein N-acyltransferase [Noviherbaspirillum sedimenti]|uniref:Apolipoprotein N-acyltransferase n=1 Tax=Noviherbaspirillum sedimenti TaxID=2320865 RepID=A0A3A3G0Z5_9BURK|nr:apolipoprotein N-acyltransferase [Noviherbaspirillum sedimenti]RJG02138.1 apolipoprotein N-acyltransferase [Noviherbaspirillum sedimenti]